MSDLHPIDVTTDLVVVGGGIAGCCAAVAAARLGLAVALVQNRPVLGGNASSEVGLLMAGADRDFRHARETGIVEEIDLASRYHNHEVQWRNAISDATLEAIVLDAGVALYLNTHIHAVAMAGANRIGSVVASQQATEKSYRFTAGLFVDATGDGSVAAWSGAEFMTGTESCDQFGESLAPEKPSKTTMGSTLMYRVKDMGRPVPFVRPNWAYRFPRPEDLPVTIRSLDRPQLWIEYGAKIDTIGDSMAIRTELLKILYGVWDHVKNHGDYGADNYALSWVGSVPGKRESRRVTGDHILTQNDVTDPGSVPDAVAYGGWPIDVHNPEGFYARRKWLDYTHLRGLYPIPYRCYYSKTIDNLFLAGRIISATHVAHGSIRLMRTCGVGGQAVGTAAWLCTRFGVSPRQLGKDYIDRLQQALLKYDCHIPGIVNRDEADLARRARVNASSEHVDSKTGQAHCARKVIGGLSRGTEEDENLWMSAATIEDRTPWISLRWDNPVALNRLHLTFDTMIRQQRFFDRPVLGAMPTCVRDFTVETLDEAGGWRELSSVQGNYHRHRIVAFGEVRTTAIRIRICSTQGDSHARIYEVRAYREP